MCIPSSVLGLTRLVEAIRDAVLSLLTDAPTDEMTTQQAAAMLGLSRPTVIKLLDVGSLKDPVLGALRACAHRSLTGIRGRPPKSIGSAFSPVPSHQGGPDMTDPAAHTDLERRLAAMNVDARRPEPIEHRLGAISPMTEGRWDSLAIQDLTEDEADAFWQAVSG